MRVVYGSPKRYVAKADSGNEIGRVFCGDCGTPLYVQVSTRPDIVGVRVCTFDDPSWFEIRPDNAKHIFLEVARHGTIIPPNIKTYAQHATRSDGRISRVFRGSAIRTRGFCNALPAPGDEIVATAPFRNPPDRARGSRPVPGSNS